ncbi:CAP domain-containing protein [Myxococcota bacterium]
MAPLTCTQKSDGAELSCLPAYLLRDDIAKGLPVRWYIAALPLVPLGCLDETLSTLPGPTGAGGPARPVVQGGGGSQPMGVAGSMQAALAGSLALSGGATANGAASVLGGTAAGSGQNAGGGPLHMAGGTDASATNGGSNPAPAAAGGGNSNAGVPGDGGTPANVPGDGGTPANVPGDGGTPASVSGDGGTLASGGSTEIGGTSADCVANQPCGSFGSSCTSNDGSSCTCRGNWVCRAGTTNNGAGGSGAGGTPAASGGTSATQQGTGGVESCTVDYGCTPTAPNTSDPYADCVARVNQFRACMCLPPLERNPAGEGCADQQSQYDSTSGAHAGMQRNICSPSGMAQNECPGWGSAEQAVDGCLLMMFQEGPGEDFNRHGHFINMTGDYTSVACGFFTTSRGEVWSVQNFFGSTRSR